LATRYEIILQNLDTQHNKTGYLRI